MPVIIKNISKLKDYILKTGFGDEDEKSGFTSIRNLPLFQILIHNNTIFKMGTKKQKIENKVEIP